MILALNERSEFREMSPEAQIVERYHSRCSSGSPSRQDKKVIN